MILYLAPGEPSYLPDGLLIPTRDQADADLAPVLCHYESRTVAWGAAALLAEQDDWCSLERLADELGKSSEALLVQLEPLVQGGVIQERLRVTGFQYRLSVNYRLRRLAQLSAAGIAAEP